MRRFATRVAALDLLREHDLLGGGQQLVAADVGEEELQAVGRAAGSGSRLGCGSPLLLLALGIRGCRRQASRSRARSARARASAPRPPRRSGRARARTPRARPARHSRAPPRPRPAPWPDPSRATRSAGSASGSTQSFRSCVRRASTSLLTLGAKSFACQGKRASRLRVFRLTGKMVPPRSFVRARRRRPDHAVVYDAGGRESWQPQDVRLLNVRCVVFFAPGRAPAARPGARRPGRG